MSKDHSTYVVDGHDVVVSIMFGEAGQKFWSVLIRFPNGQVAGRLSSGKYPDAPNPDSPGFPAWALKTFQAMSDSDVG